MKLLICTQAVDKNDPILGFFHRWIEEFSKHAEYVHVICLKKGVYNLPPNVSVHSLGKEEVLSRIEYVSRFYRYIWQQRREYDAVFVHMNSEYVILGGFFWRLWGKRVGLWYVHKSVTALLRFAVLLVHHVFTTSRESLRLETSKRIETGHGIDTEQFTPTETIKDDTLRILTTGRVSETKRIAEMIDVVDRINTQGQKVLFSIVGEPVTSLDKEYLNSLRSDLERRGLSGVVNFEGAISHDLLPEILHKSDVFLNLSKTGSMDKAVLEALSSGVPVVTSNEAFQSLLEPLDLFVSADNIEEIAETIERAKGMNMENVVEYVRDQHSLPSLITRITSTLSS